MWIIDQPTQHGDRQAPLLDSPPQVITEPLGERERPSVIELTTFMNEAGLHLDTLRDGTATLQELAKSVPSGKRQARSMSVRSEQERVSETRVQLLKMRFAGQVDPEHEARIAILERRLQLLVPVVSRAEWDALERSVDKLEQWKAKFQSIRQQKKEDGAV